MRLRPEPRQQRIGIATEGGLRNGDERLAWFRVNPRLDAIRQDPRFRRLPIVTELVARAGGAQQAKVVLGSMKTVQDTEALVYQVFMQVAS